MTDTVQNVESSLISDATDTISVFFGSDTITPNANHVRFGMAYGFVAGWLLGIWRKGQKPEVNALGF